MADFIKSNYRDQAKAFIPSEEKYRELYTESIVEPDCFWTKQAERLSWSKKWNKVSDVDWIIEVVVERLDIKKQVFEKIEKFLIPLISLKIMNW